jgi:hypothetical protein
MAPGAYLMNPVCQSERLDAVTRPLLSQASRGIRAEDPDREVDQTPDDRNTNSEKKEPSNQPEDTGQNSEEKLEHEQARNREEPDHEDCAEHSWGLQTRTVLSYAAVSAAVSTATAVDARSICVLAGRRESELHASFCA